jgi:small subunit ribosomal protein S9
MSDIQKPTKKTTVTRVKSPVKRTPVKTVARTVHTKPVAATKSVVKPRVSSSGFVAAVGRRKEAVARVRLQKQGSGNITVNGRPVEQYFTTMDFRQPVLQPLQLAGLEKEFDVSVKVSGGGKVGQAEAIRLGIARALVMLDENYRKQMRPAGFLTRDSRVKERKKYGLKKARRAPQFSKR